MLQTAKPSRIDGADLSRQRAAPAEAGQPLDQRQMQTSISGEQPHRGERLRKLHGGGDRAAVEVQDETIPRGGAADLEPAATRPMCRSPAQGKAAAQAAVTRQARPAKRRCGSARRARGSARPARHTRRRSRHAAERSWGDPGSCPRFAVTCSPTPVAGTPSYIPQRGRHTSADHDPPRASAAVPPPRVPRP